MAGPETRDVPFLKVAGPPFERGAEHGSAAKRLIEHNIDLYLAAFRHHAGLGHADVLEAARPFIPIIERFDEELLREMQGIAEGAGRRLEEIVALNCRNELIFSTADASGCTSFAIEPDVSVSKKVIVGQNWDWKSRVADTRLLLQIVQPGRPTVVTLTEAGIVGKFGFNSAGLALFVNFMSADARGHGVPLNVMRRGILNAPRMSDAVGLVLKSPRSIAGNYLLAHGDGEMVDLEVSPASVDLVWPKDGILTHANHFVTHPIAVKDVGRAVFPDTVFRDRQLRRLLEASSRPITIDTIKTALSDHRNFPAAVCRHPDTDDAEEERFETLSSMIVDFGSEQVHLAPGPPCQTPFKTIAFGELLSAGGGV